MFRLAYDSLLHIYALMQLPRALIERRKSDSARTWFNQRLGLGLPKLEGQGGVWLHAVSMGEVRAAAPVIKRLLEERPARLIVSTVTQTGHAEAKRILPEAAAHIYLPADLTYLIRPIVRQYAPDLVVVTETDYWFNFLDEAKRLGAHVVVINGKISERSARNHRRLPLLSRRLLRSIDLFCLQDEIYKGRFEEIGVSSEWLRVTGNIKLDQKLPSLSDVELEEFRKRLKVPSGLPVLVAGSSHDPEEELLLDAMTEVWRSIPDARLILVPRHPARFDEVVALAKRRHLRVGRYSEAERLQGDERVVVIDAMGVLLSCYQLANVALVCGSWTDRVGGHNILEPLHFGVPVLFGPHMASQPTLLRLVEEFGAGMQVESGDIGKALLTLLHRPELREELSENGRELLEKVGGAVERTVDAITRVEGENFQNVRFSLCVKSRGC
jgi:3-deoxy-D-manno-octulosonic-acid transferase